MAHTLPLTGKFTDEPLGIALMVAAVLHALLVFGVSFDLPRFDRPNPERTLDISLIPPQTTENKPEEPDFLAQQSSAGGAPEFSEERPTAPPSQPAVVPKPQPSIEEQRAGAPEPKPVAKQPVLTAQESTRKVEPRRLEKTVRSPERLDVTQLLDRSRKEIEQLSLELDQHTRMSSRTLRRRAINASTQEYKYASYLEAWRKKVERIGNLNYPDEAKRKKLYGNLLLHVPVQADGTIEGNRIRVVRSSGHKTLDDAAIRIVKLAAPFAPFPPEIRREVDVLDITRTWQFLSNNRLFSAK